MKILQPKQYPESWEKQPDWNGKLGVRIGYAQDGVCRLALMSSATADDPALGSLVVPLYRPLHPFANLIEWLNEIADNKLPTSVELSGEVPTAETKNGLAKTFVARPYAGVHKNKPPFPDIELRGHAGGETVFLMRANRKQLLSEFANRMEEWIKDNHNNEEWNGVDKIETQPGDPRIVDIWRLKSKAETIKELKPPLPKKRDAYYIGIAGKPDSGVKREKVTLDFAKKAVAGLSVEDDKIKDSFFGVEITDFLDFQVKKSDRQRYYVEILDKKFDSRHYYFTFAYCTLPLLNALLEVVWETVDRASFFENAPSKINWDGKYSVSYRQPAPSEPGGEENGKETNPIVTNEETGIFAKEIPDFYHNWHWRFLSNVKEAKEYGVGFEKNFFPFTEKIFREDDTKHFECRPPFKQFTGNEFVLLQNSIGSIFYSAILGASKGEDLALKSIYPSFVATCVWEVKIESIQPKYGPYSALINGKDASGHPLQWFAPDFLRYANDWRRTKIARVHFAALGIHLRKFEAEPVVITKGPRIKEEKERLLKEGKSREAKELKSVTFTMNEIRTMYSTLEEDTEGHVEIVGKILEMRKIKIKTWETVSGYILDVDVLHDDFGCGHILPVYVFGAALGDYVPKHGDLISGEVWLHGRFHGEASPRAQQFFEDE